MEVTGRGRVGVTGHRGRHGAIPDLRAAAVKARFPRRLRQVTPLLLRVTEVGLACRW